jgi:hypothetical protein
MASRGRVRSSQRSVQHICRTVEEKQVSEVEREAKENCAIRAQKRSTFHKQNVLKRHNQQNFVLIDFFFLRLRKLWAIEKLAGNMLQKIIFEQVAKSQATEDGFQKIREVTGLTDVMDIVHKFLNRDVEHEQLKTAVKDAEARLEVLRDEFKKNYENRCLIKIGLF